jgi:hypothetical protein
MFQQPPHHLHTVLHVNKITDLLPVAIFFFIGLEKPDLARFPDLVEGFKDHTGHVALVVLIGTEDIEEFDTCDLLFRLLFQHPQIENLLGIAVHVDGTKLGNQPVVIGKAL